MLLPKDSATITFSQGIDTKNDPNQLSFGKYTSLQNSIFNTLNRLSKRYGFDALASIGTNTASYLTTYNGGLTAIGQNISVYSDNEAAWTTNAVNIPPLQLSTLPIYRSTSNQVMCDSQISNIGTVCTVFGDTSVTGTIGTTTFIQNTVYKYVINDGATGINLIPATNIPFPATVGTVSYSPRVFSLGDNFIIAFATSSASGTFGSTSGRLSNLSYIAVPTSSHGFSVVSSISILTNTYLAVGSQGSFDGIVASNTLYLSWNTITGVQFASISSSVSASSIFAISSQTANIMSVCADSTQSPPVIWSSFVSGSTTAYSVATAASASGFYNVLPQTLNTGANTSTIVNLASAAQIGQVSLFYECANTYNYDTSIQTNFIQSALGTLASGFLGSPSVSARSVGIASKAFIDPYNAINVIASYQSPYQSTYFVLPFLSSVPIAKFAYGNGGGYVTRGLPSISTVGSSISASYLVKDFVASVNKGTAVGSTTQTAAIYTQTGVNQATFNFGTSSLRSLEAENNLHVNGGFLSIYDGYTYAEHNFHLWPDSVEATALAGSAGGILPQTYYYQATYEWTDNTGNVFRSAPSIPTSVVVGSGSGTVLVNVPTIRLTGKTNPRIVIYRWSTTQQTYYQVTSLTNPLQNSKTQDYLVYVDNQSDAAIIGNTILYTNGGVLEDTGTPACTDITQFDTRLWAILAEDENLLAYSKPLVESEPVEMSDLQTIYVSPSVGVEGSTGPMKCIFPMDDKLIIFKKNAIYYINGTGPDATGANSQYSEPIFVTTTVGCINKNSIVLIPQGLLFQSQKGIWLLGRDLSTRYIGQDVESYNSQTVLSVIASPNSNEIRFSMSGGKTITYDYFVGQWNENSSSGVSSTVYKGVHAYIDSSGGVFKENISSYLDGTTPVTMSFTTGWVNLLGLQGYKRAYWMDILGNFQSGNTYTIGIAYDYNPAIVQTATVTPTNTIGSGSQVEQWQVNFQRTQCQSFQLTFNEISSGTAGAGLTLSGVNLVYGKKKMFPRNISPKNRTG